MFFLVVLVATVIATLYGVGHDQVTYTISPEYYTKFKFIQFNLADSGAAQHMTQPRSAVVLVGVKGSWWMGAGIGVVLGLFALIYRNADSMFQSAVQAFGVLIGITMIFGGIGYYYGHDTVVKTKDNLRVPSNVADKAAFITAGTIHDFTYLGGAVGLFAGIIFLLLKYIRLRRR